MPAVNRGSRKALNTWCKFLRTIPLRQALAGAIPKFFADFPKRQINFAAIGFCQAQLFIGFAATHRRGKVQIETELILGEFVGGGINREQRSGLGRGRIGNLKKSFLRGLAML